MQHSLTSLTPTEIPGAGGERELVPTPEQQSCIKIDRTVEPSFHRSWKTGASVSTNNKRIGPTGHFEAQYVNLNILVFHPSTNMKVTA